MKKALLVLGFALCASFAFAQTGNFGLPKSACKVTVEGPKAAAVDYKASIFTKTDTVIRQFTFNADEVANMVYGAAGHVGAGQIIWTEDANGNFTVPDTLLVHGQSGAYSNWQRIPDSANIYTNSAYSSLADWMKSGIAQRMGSRYAGNNDGYMLMTCRAAIGTGAHDAFFALPGVPVPQDIDVTVIDLAFIQAYAKFYDQCYIDYKVGNQWRTRAINVEGIDVDINYYASINQRYTMPLPLASEDTIYLRVRWLSDGTRSNSYGYFWGVDNLTIVSSNADRWYTNDQKFLDGAYGTIPEGMEIPLGWFGNVYNNGSNARTGITLEMEHFGDDRTNGETFISTTVPNLPADPLARQIVSIDERGFLNGEIVSDSTFAYPDDYDYLGWWWRGNTYGQTAINPNQYTLRSLPVDETGANYVAAHMTSDPASIAEWDTIGYMVSDLTGGEAGREVEGYRWAHDNGIIPSQSIYSYGWVQEGNNFYITPDGGYDLEGYTIWLRYTTGNDIPEGLCFRGLEIVPNTVNSVDDIAGSEIIPMIRIAGPHPDGPNYVHF